MSQMSKLKYTLSTLLLLVGHHLSFLSADEGATKRQTIPTVTLRGRVLDQPNGQGVAGVRITVDTGLGYGLDATTDKRGAYPVDVEVLGEAYTPSLWITGGYLSPGESTAHRVCR